LEQPRSSSVAERVVDLIWIVRGHDRDVKTVRAWAHAAGHSQGGICQLLSLAASPPKIAPDLARLLRARRLALLGHGPIGSVMEISDERTLSRMIARCGLRQGDLDAAESQILYRQVAIVTPIVREGLILRARRDETTAQFTTNST
jgi:hypothetical protein